jgi:hypothetical protein
MGYTIPIMYKVLLLALLIAPQFTFAAYSVQSLITGLMGFFDTILIPFILGIAFLVFIVNAVRYFVFESGNTEGQENARNVALYSIGAFVFILSFWGIVNIMNSGFGFQNNPCKEDITSDYVMLSKGGAFYQTDPNAPCSLPVPAGGIMGGGDGISTTTLPAVGATEAVAVKTNFELVRAGASTVDLATLYGANKDVVATTLYPDLIKPQNSVSDLDHLRGASRLRAGGAINPALVTSYLSAITAYNTAIGHRELNDSLTPDAIAQIIVTPLPASVTANITNSKNDFTAAINTYNASRDMSLPIASSVIPNMFDTTHTTAERLSAFTIYRDSLTSKGILTPAMATTFLQNINTENAFAGNFTNPQR